MKAVAKTWIEIILNEKLQLTIFFFSFTVYKVFSTLADYACHVDLFQAREDATQVVANLQRQQVHSRLIASDHLEANKDLMDILISG